MNQILGLRPYFNEKKGKWEVTDNTFFARNWRVESLPDLFANIDKYIGKIPVKERFNLFYTVASCTEKKREFKEQHVIIFDIDKMDLTKKDLYIKAVCHVLGIELSETGIVESGNGLHFVIGLKNPILENSYFDANRMHYKALCDKINSALRKLSLPGESDPAVFDPRRIMRLPGTENRKEGKEVKQCKLFQPSITAIDFDIRKISGIPSVEAAEQITTQALKKYPTPDTDAILAGCDFLKWCKESPNEVSEAQWYGMLSVIPRLPPNGRDIAHAFSKGHRSYSEAETESKIDQALAASGPRTCENFSRLAGKCGSCKYQGKITSPIMIQGEKYIKTKDQGFHDMAFDQRGNPKPGKPNYEDLRRYFESLHPYVTLGGECLTWNGKFWQPYEDGKLQSFAQAHFRPTADTRMVTEFQNLICRTNRTDAEWFINTTHRKINFSNGILDLTTLVLAPHSTEAGFRYVLPYNYESTATAPLFEAFISQIMHGRKDLIDTLLQFAGYALSNDSCWAQKALIMTGVGSNGKSTYMDVLKALVGTGNYSSLTLGELKSPTSRKLIDGMLFNLAEETPDYAMTESSTFKTMAVGGEILVKALYKQEYRIVTRAKLMFACNELPKTRDTTRGYFRRLLVVPFDAKFEGAEIDPFILKKLIAELPGIFNLVMKAYTELRAAQRFPDSAAMNEAIDNYRSTIDNVKAWYDNCVQPNLEPVDSPRAVDMPLTKLYAAYRIYTDAAGEKPETQATFSRRLGNTLDQATARWSRRMVGGKREIYYRGVKFAEGVDY